MKLLLNLSLALCLGLTAQTAQAVDHEVYITQKGFFPKTIYMGANDRFVFKNVSGYTASITQSTRVCNQWNCWWNNVLIMSVGNNGEQTLPLSSTLLTLINASGSKIPAPKLSNGSSSWTASNGTNISYDVPPTACPDSRAFCAPSYTNGSANP